ncbi:MAG: lysophospholipid acyltransferase family protein [Sphingomonas sp.]
MAYIRTILFSLIFYPGSLVYVVSALAFARDTVSTQRHARRWALFHRWCARHLLGIKTRTEGPVPDGPVLYAAKHQAMFETFELLALLDGPAIVLKQELIDVPLWGQVVANYGVIPVDRDGAAGALRTMLAAARKAVKAGRPLLIFPEGTRVPPGEAPPLRPGFAGLYRIAGLPVVPIAIDSGRAWPRRGPKRAGTITFRFGEPIPPGLQREEIEARVHAAINVLEP